MKKKIADQAYLRNDQYRSAVNLNHRIALHAHYSTNPTPWTTWVYQHLALKSNQHVLAVGCGNATQWRDNASRFPMDVQIFLMDLSIGMVQDGKSGIGANQRFSYLSGDIQSLPFTDRRFDRVTANHMLYHVPDMQKGIRDCARVLHPDGLFLAASNGSQHMLDFYDLLSAFDASFQIPEQQIRRFGLENGGMMLSEVFTEVRLDRYECDLWVTDAQPLVDYAFSMWDVRDTIAMEKEKAMLAFFADRIRTTGGIRIRKESGIFLASHQSGLIDSLGVLQAE